MLHWNALRPNKICMNFGLSSEKCSSFENVSNSWYFFVRLSIRIAFEGHSLIIKHCVSFSLCARLSLLLFHLLYCWFSQFYCIIYTDKRFPFNINVKFIANIMQNGPFSTTSYSFSTKFEQNWVNQTKPKNKNNNNNDNNNSTCAHKSDPCSRHNVFFCFFNVGHCGSLLHKTFVLSCMKIVSRWTTAVTLNERI